MEKPQDPGLTSREFKMVKWRRKVSSSLAISSLLAQVYLSNDDVQLLCVEDFLADDTFPPTLTATSPSIREYLTHAAYVHQRQIQGVPKHHERIE